MRERVVITGMGTVNPLGLSVNESWVNIVNGKSGVGPISLFDSEDLLVQIACEVKNFDPEAYLTTREARRRDRYEQFATAAAQEAVQQAGLEVNGSKGTRVGVIVSSSIGGIKALQDNIMVMLEFGPRRLSPFVVPMLMSNGAAGLLSIDHGFQGPSLSIVSACASSTDGIGTAWMMIRSGMIDAALAGGSDATITLIGIAGLDRLGAMSRRNINGSPTPQPFDLNRDGLVMGEGAAILVLESESHAKARGAEILAELAGYGSTTDAFHITAPSEDGIGASQAICGAMETAGLSTHQIDYINAHGTATRLNDVSETKAIKRALGKRAYEVPISSTKSMTGHMIGTTGALEAIFCVKAIQENVIPPTINYQTPDPECDLDYVPNVARETPIHVTLSNAFGFGGHNAVLAIRDYQ